MQYPAPTQDYKVLVRCFTYNQSKYIKDTLNSFAAQQTNFPYVCLVMDDASTDGEQEIIKEWMECECDMSKAEVYDIPTSFVIVTAHKTNKLCSFAFYLLKQNLYNSIDKKMSHLLPWRNKCMYEAFCEGDDYWIDYFKLQRQVEFLDNNPDYGLVYGKAKIFIQNKNKFKGYLGDKISKYDDLIIKNKCIPTATVLIRSNILSEYFKCIYNNSWIMGDYPLWLYVTSHYKIYYINSTLAIYRYLEKSASSRNDYEKRKNFILAGYNITISILSQIGYYDLNKIENNINIHLFNHAYLYKHKKDGQYYFQKIRNKTLKLTIKFLLLKYFISK